MYYLPAKHNYSISGQAASADCRPSRKLISNYLQKLGVKKRSKTLTELL